MIDMREYYDMVKKYNVDVIYSGPLWADGIEGIGGTIRKRMEFDQLPLSSTQAVFSIFVEQMNNMLMHSADTKLIGENSGRMIPPSKGVFILGSKDKVYFVQSGNVMRNGSVDTIKSQIDYLNTLDKPGLRKYYKEQIKLENANKESDGAGIGLIEIARRATSKIQYSFEPYSEGLTFFTMYVTIGDGEGARK